MSNQIPRTYDPIIQLLEDAVDGAARHGAAIELKQNTEADLRADLYALIGEPTGPGGAPPAKPGFKALWNTAKANKTAKSAALRVLESNGRELVMACVNSLKPVLGKKWNAAWAQAGFMAGSLEVPAHPQGLLLQLRAYYAANPTREVANVNGVACTAAACQAMANAIQAADKASNDSNSDAVMAHRALNDGMAAARTRLSGLLAELTQLLNDEDPRWLAFGFDMPGHPSAPDVPANLVVLAGAAGSHTLFVHCDHARRADKYRFRVLDTANPPNELAEQLMSDTEASFGNLTPGVQVAVVVSAHNATGDSQESAPVLITVP